MSTKSLFGSRGKKTASLLLAVSLFLTSFSSLSFAEVLTNADGLVTNLQTSGSAYLSASGVGEASGGFSYQFDLSLPKGRTNLTPEISIQYQNQSASDQQIFGYGFSLSIPFVERTNKYGSEKMFDPAYETFRSSLAGELVQDGSVYRAKNEFGDFVSLSRNGNEWIGTTKDGLTYRFGSDGFSQQSDPNDSSRISRWYLSSITDPNNNVVSYQYTEGTGVVYPASISYGGRYSITFATETAPVHSSYELGFLSERDQRINSVSVFDLSNEILRYNFVFSTGVNTRRDLLQSITAVDTISSVSLPPVTFTYAGDTLPAWIHDNSVDFPEPLNQSVLNVTEN